MTGTNPRSSAEEENSFVHAVPNPSITELFLSTFFHLSFKSKFRSDALP